MKVIKIEEPQAVMGSQSDVLETQKYSIDEYDEEESESLQGALTYDEKLLLHASKYEHTFDTSTSFKSFINSSVKSDATKLSNMFNVNVDTVCKKLHRFRNVPNRVEFVANILIEESKATDNDSDLSTKSGNDTAYSDFPILKDVAETIRFLSQIHPEKKFDPNAVFTELEKHSNDPSRIVLAANAFTRKIVEENEKSAGKRSSSVKRSKSEFENDKNSKEETDSSLKLNHSPVKRLKQNNGFEDDPKVDVVRSADTVSKEEQELIENDPIYRDTCVIARFYPTHDKNEIYAFLEANHNRPNRIAVVSDELARIQQERDDLIDRRPSDESRDSKEEDAELSYKKDEVDVVVNNGTESAATNSANGLRLREEKLKPLVLLEKDVEAIRNVVPDCDPMWLYEKLATMDEKERVQQLSADLFENRSYPRLRDRLQKERANKDRARLLAMELDIEKLLSMLPDPEAHFMDENPAVSLSYKTHCEVFVRNRFTMLRESYLNEVCARHNYHYTPICFELEELLRNNVNVRISKCDKRFLSSKRPREALPVEPDEYFYLEEMFVNNRKRVKGYFFILLLSVSCPLRYNSSCHSVFFFRFNQGKGTTEKVSSAISEKSGRSDGVSMLL